MEYYDNLVEGINGLKKQGYTEDFNIKENWLECQNGVYKVFHNEFDIDKYFRIESDSDADDSSILYAISSDKFNLKGVLVNAYGMYSDDMADELLDKLNIK